MEKKTKRYTLETKTGIMTIYAGTKKNGKMTLSVDLLFFVIVLIYDRSPIKSWTLINIEYLQNMGEPYAVLTDCQMNGTLLCDFDCNYSGEK